MKIKAMILGCLIGVLVLFISYKCSWAKPKAKSKIGIVSIRRILQDCQRSAKYRQEVVAEYDRVKAELGKLEAEIEADKAGLRTLKTGSSDQMAMLKDILMKKGSLEAQQKFYEQQMGLKEQRMVEELYQDILRITKEVAEQNGLDLVFEKTEPKFPMLSGENLERTISAHKVLYSGGCLDISEEVMARLDAGN